MQVKGFVLAGTLLGVGAGYQKVDVVCLCYVYYDAGYFARTVGSFGQKSWPNTRL